jgi:hypothetical protein
MAVDPARALLVTKQYRYKIIDNASIKALYPNADELIIETNLDEAGGNALASSLFNQTKDASKTFTLDIEGLIYAEDFIGGPNRYTVSFSRHPAAGSNVYTLIKAKPQFFDGRTTITVRG